MTDRILWLFGLVQRGVTESDYPCTFIATTMINHNVFWKSSFTTWLLGLYPPRYPFDVGIHYVGEMEVGNPKRLFLDSISDFQASNLLLLGLNYQSNSKECHIKSSEQSEPYCDFNDRLSGQRWRTSTTWLRSATEMTARPSPSRRTSRSVKSPWSNRWGRL